MNPTKFQIRTEDAGQPLQKFLAARLAFSLNAAKRLLDQRTVFVNGRRVWMARHLLQAGDVVECATAPAAIKYGPPAAEILHADPDLLIVNKPADILSNGPRSLETALQAKYGPDLHVVHRLDKETSGCLIAALNARAFDAVVPLFGTGGLRKHYRALATGGFEKPEGAIALPLEGKSALTEYRVLADNGVVAHLDLLLQTGRTHQIRRHLAMTRHPVIGDKQYGFKQVDAFVLRAVPRHMLHAHELSFRSPLSGKVLHVVAPLPADFTALLQRLGL